MHMNICLLHQLRYPQMFTTFICAVVGLLAAITYLYCLVYLLWYLLSFLNERGFDSTVDTRDPSPAPVGNLHACHCHSLR